MVNNQGISADGCLVSNEEFIQNISEEEKREIREFLIPFITIIILIDEGITLPQPANDNNAETEVIDDAA